MADSFNLRDYGITVAQVDRNLPLGALYEREASIVDNGALAACSGVKTGRSATTKFVLHRLRDFSWP